MASGSFNVTTSNRYITGTVTWSSVKNIAGNYSDVNVALRVSRTNTGYTTEGFGTWGVYADGQVQYETNMWATITYNSNTLVCQKAFRVYHNNDGKKTITISSSGGITGTSYTWTEGSSTVALDTIERASTITLNDYDIDLATPVTVTIARASTSFTHTIRYSYGNSVANIGTGVATTINWTPPIALASETPSMTYGTAGIFCDTYSGTTLIGTNMVYIKLNVPSTVLPTFTDVTSSDLVLAVSNLMGASSRKYIDKLSNVKFTLTGGTAPYGASIVSTTITINQVDYIAKPSGVNGSVTSNYSTGILDMNLTPEASPEGGVFGATRITYGASVTDSRGRTISMTKNDIIIYPYTPPKITDFTVVRCLSDGTINDLGTYVKIVRGGSVKSLYYSTEKNTIAITIKSKARTSEDWIIATSTTNPPSNPIGINLSATSTLTAGANATYIYGSGASFPITTAYDFRIEIVDKFNTTYSQAIIPYGKTVMSLGQTGVGIGKVWSQGSLDIDGDVYSNGLYNGALRVTDTRAINPTPNDLPDYSMSTFFNPNYGLAWASGISVKGWNDGYEAWQLACPASNVLVENIRFRVGKDTTWNAWRNLWHDGNIGMTGGIMYFANSNVPVGWLKANGALISRTTYANLFAIISTYYGAGDGSTTFALPDLRGVFTRGWDDGRGYDSGRVFGSLQLSENLTHSHGQNISATPNSGGSGVRQDYVQDASGLTAYAQGINTGASGGTESRPVNVAMLACIKY